MNGGNKHTSMSQLFLSRLLRFVTITGLSLITLGFAVYISEILPSQNSPDEITALWHLSSQEYAVQASHPQGWDWLWDLGDGEIVSLATLVVIPAAIIICLCIMIVVFIKDKDRIYAGMLALQVIILVLAASGILSGQ